MATISITVPVGIVPRVQAAFVAAYGYQATVPDPANPGATIPNPENVMQFVQRKLRDHIKEVVKGHEAVTAANTARSTAITTVDNEIILT